MPAVIMMDGRIRTFPRRSNDKTQKKAVAAQISAVDGRNRKTGKQQMEIIKRISGLQKSLKKCDVWRNRHCGIFILLSP